VTQQLVEVVFELDGLRSFLERRGHTLLIKGLAGTGKTTLSLHLLSELGKGREEYTYHQGYQRQSLPSRYRG